MTTPAEQEAERRYPEPNGWRGDLLTAQLREAFEDGAEWSESRYRELLEAAREYIAANRSIADEGRTVERVDRENEAWMRLLAAAAALGE